MICSLFYSFLYLVGFALLLFPGGTWFCRVVLQVTRILPTSKESAKQSQELRTGRTVGYLERFLVVVTVYTGAWQLLLAVIALKTISRYKDLDEKLSAEYFLIGSLASLAWAILCGLALQRMGCAFTWCPTTG